MVVTGGGPILDVVAGLESPRAPLREVGAGLRRGPRPSPRSTGWDAEVL